jgi:uncharacterized membrane protein YgcG
MSWKRSIWIGIVAICIALLGIVPGAWAQDYSFNLERNISHVVVNRDGSADIEYWMTFVCDKNAHPIDIVDIGMPNATYDLSTAQAWYDADGSGTNESPLTDIRKSEWLSIGVEIHMGKYTIQPGQRGTLHFKIRVREMVYPDQDEAYASVEFAPHYYDSSTVHGKTYMEIHLYFPPGVTNEETRYHDQQFDEVDKVDDRIVFIWVYPNDSGSVMHKQGISFPRTYVDTVFKAPVVVGSGGSSGGGGSSLGNALENFAGCGFAAVFVAVMFGAPILSVIQNKRRKMKYLPPSLAVEGVGIKRGLTAVEASILLEKPLNTILTMILFGLLKKKAVSVITDNPLKLEAVEPRPTAQFRDYEEDFLQAIQKDGTLDEKQLQKGIVGLIKSVNTKIKGFSRKESVAYYKSIVDRAWSQVTAENTAEIKSKYFDQGLEWMMMDEKFQEKAEGTFSSGPVFLPPWWAYYRPWVPTVRSARSSGGGSSSGPSSSSSGGRGGQISLPTLPGAAFAGTVVGGLERTAGSIVSKLESFTGGVTQRTNPPPASSSSHSYRSGGSGGCACACACAGCACACAGGGR